MGSFDQTERALTLADRVTFGILTALPKEYAAMKAMLNVPVSYRAPGRGGGHDYELGEIPAKGGGTHAVALVLGDQGNSTAAVHATTLLHDFSQVEALVMVGIGGGVPSPAKAETHVRLGDVVVSGEQGVVKYDFVKEHANDRIEPRHPPRAPSKRLRDAARRLESSERSNRPWVQHIQRAADLGVSRPAPNTDSLADTRDPTQSVEHPEDDRRRNAEPRVFEGTIGAADRLQKNAVRRDMLRDQFGVRAIEMEGFGVAEATYMVEVGFFVVRGICDYCDSHKGDEWQDYAAIVAAAYARALLEEVSVSPPHKISAHRERNHSSLQNEPSRIPKCTSALTTPAGSSHVGLRVGALDADPMVELEHQAHLDGARAVLLRGHALLALEQLETLRGRIWNGAAKPVRARILTLTGHAELELGRFEAAGRSLVDALEENPSDAKTLANGALGHALLGNNDTARHWAQKALAVDTTNLLARQILIQEDEREDEEVRKENELTVGKRAEIFFALGQRAARKSDSICAAKWFEAAAELDGSDADIVAAAGQSLVTSIVARTADRGYGWEEPSITDTSTLRRAGELIQRAWSQLKDDEVRRARVHWLISFGMVRRMLGEREEAVAIAEDALKIGGQTTELVRFRAAVAADASDYGTVVRLLADRDEDDLEIIGLLATAEANLGHHDAANALWTRLLNRELPDYLREQAERNQVFTLIEAGRFDEARNLVSNLIAQYPTLARHLVAIDVAVRVGDHALRDQLLEKAMTLATRDASARVLLRLGDALMAARRPGDAADVYGLVILESGIHERDARRLVTALYRAGRIDSALALCKRLATTDGTSRFCTEIESVILEDLGDLLGARAACERYLATEPNNTAVLVRLGIILLRAGDTVGVSALLDGVPMKEVIADLEVGILFVQLLLEAGREREVLEAVFELRRRHLGEPRAHLLYIGQHTLLTRHDKEPTTIGAEVAVRLTGTDAPKEWILITREPSMDARGEEITPSDPLAKALIGKCVGETVSFESAPHRRWSIAELSSKHVFAYRQSLSQFGRRFPQDGRLEQHEAPDDANQLVADVTDRLQRSEPHWQRVLDMYGGSGSVTVGAIGTSLRRSPSESLGIVLTSPHGLIASTNTTEEKRLAARLLERDGVTLVADYSALSLLSELEVLDSALAGRSVAVAQSTIDAFRQELGRWKLMPDDGFMSLGVREGQMLKHVLGSDDVVRGRRRYETLIGWIRTRCTILPVAPRVAEQHAEKRELGKWLGKCFWDSILLTAEPNRILLSDDLKLRLLGRSLVGADGIASAHLLIAQRAAGRLDALTCATALVKLVVAGYKHIPTDASMLEAAARLEKWSPFGAFQRVLETLRGSETEVNSAVVVAAEFFRLAWFGLLLPQQRDALCLAVIDALVAGRTAKDVFPRLRHAISTIFKLIPDAANDMNRILRVWSMIHLQ